MNNSSLPYRELRRSHSKRMLAGVCGGLGDFFGIDPTVVRLVFVFGVLFGFGWLLLVYLALFIVVPEESLMAPVQPVIVQPEPVEAQPTIIENA